MDYKDKLVIITGASSGIGYATACAFAKRGSIVIAVARREERLQELMTHCQKTSPQSHYISGDLSQREFAERIIHETYKKFGRIDVLINNAASQFRKLIYDITIDEVEQLLRTNLLSQITTTLTAIPYLLKNQQSYIVNVSSFASKIIPTYESIYCTSKCAINGFTEGLWNDLQGSNIHVSLVQPGPIRTEIWQDGDRRSSYKGKLFPPEVVANIIFEAIEKKRFEMIAPKNNPKLLFARFLRLVFPGIIRYCMKKIDPIDSSAIDKAKPDI